MSISLGSFRRRQALVAVVDLYENSTIYMISNADVLPVISIPGRD